MFILGLFISLLTIWQNRSIKTKKDAQNLFYFLCIYFGKYWPNFQSTYFITSSYCQKEYNRIPKYIYVFTVQLQQHQETPMKVMDIQFVEIQLVSNPILITVRNIIPVKTMAKVSFYQFNIDFLLDFTVPEEFPIFSLKAILFFIDDPFSAK